jgi:SAM-dependent methyltransferase
MSLKDRLLASPLAYRLLQAPFADRKLGPVLAGNDLRRVRRVLDVGCGPGTNARHFQHAAYLGLDLNPRYIEAARRRFKGEFVVADVTRYSVEAQERFDFILVNSLLHHLDDDGTRRVLSHLGSLLTTDGHVHVLDLVEPERPGIARTLARWDRGHHARPLGRWRELFGEVFEEVAFQPYALPLLGQPLWNMVYFKGCARSEGRASRTRATTGDAP